MTIRRGWKRELSPETALLLKLKPLYQPYTRIKLANDLGITPPEGLSDREFLAWAKARCGEISAKFMTRIDELKFVFHFTSHVYHLERDATEMPGRSRHTTQEVWIPIPRTLFLEDYRRNLEQLYSGLRASSRAVRAYTETLRGYWNQMMDNPPELIRKTLAVQVNRLMEGAEVWRNTDGNYRDHCTIYMGMVELLDSRWMYSHHMPADLRWGRGVIHRYYNVYPSIHLWPEEAVIQSHRKLVDKIYETQNRKPGEDSPDPDPGGAVGASPAHCHGQLHPPGSAPADEHHPGVGGMAGIHLGGGEE